MSAEKLSTFKSELAKYIPESEVEALTHVVDSGKGSFYRDISGRNYLDFSSGVFTNTYGAGDQELNDTLRKIFGVLSNIHGRPWSGALEFYQRLFRLLPSQNYRAVTYGDGGGYSVDRVLYEIYYHFGKTQFNVTTFDGGFHGKTFGAKLAMNPNEECSFFKSHIVSPPYCYRCPFKKQRESCDLACVEAVKEKLLACRTQVFLFEPILGSAVIIPPKDYWRRIEEFCKAHEILMVADEVLVGGGRIGTFLASTYYEIEPDIIILTKGLANGLPLSIILFKKFLTEHKWSRRKLHYSSTFMSVPALMAVACKVLEKIERDDILANVTSRGEQLFRGMKLLQKKFPVIGDVRGFGLIVAMELVTVDDSPNSEACRKIFRAAEENGLELIEPTNHILRVAPPLNVTSEEISLCLNLLERSFEHVCK